MKESVNLHMEKVHLIRQKLAASVISNGMKKIYVVKKKERLKREEEEKERRRKEQEEKMKRKEQEEKMKRKIEQNGKDEEKPTKVGFITLIEM